MGDSDASVGQGGDSDSESEQEVIVARQYRFSEASNSDSDSNAGRNSRNRREAPEHSENSEGSAEEDEDFTPKTKPSSNSSKSERKPDQSAAPAGGFPERIPRIVTIGKFQFQRGIKKRNRAKGFDVDYKLLNSEEHGEKSRVFHSKPQLSTFLQNKGEDNPDLTDFDFTQKYTETGELTNHGRLQLAGKEAVPKTDKKKKRKGEKLVESRSAKKSKPGPIEDNHPLSRCVQILREVMAHRAAPPFNEPVNLKVWPSYLDAVKEPMDLGTVYERLCDGLYQTAHEVRRDASLVWLNCVLFNGEDAPITKDVKKLAKMFDEKFQEQIPAPTHMGMRKMIHGSQWVGHKVTVYFDDCRWYDGEIADYDESRADEKYQIKYEDDEEWVALPSVDITITDAWDQLGKPIEPWQGLPTEHHSGVAMNPHRPQRSRNVTKQYVPNEGAGPSGGSSKARKKNDSKANDGGAPETPEKERREHEQAQAEVVPRADGEKRPEDFFCDDGGPCGEVCRCRLLFWCRFKTRKGVILGTTKGKTMMGVIKQERCSYSQCPHPTVSSNDRWHYISSYTASGGRDWSELLGQTLCSSCFQQYRSKGTLLRVRDLPTG